MSLTGARPLSSAFGIGGSGGKVCQTSSARANENAAVTMASIRTIVGILNIAAPPPDGAVTPRLEPSMTGPTRAGNRDVSGSNDADGEFADAVDAALQPVAALHGADAGRCAGEDQIAGLEDEETGEVADDLRHFPDELGEIALLAQFA